MQSLSIWISLDSLLNILLKRLLMKAKSTTTVFEIFLSEGKTILSLAKWLQGAKELNTVYLIFCYMLLKNVILSMKNNLQQWWKKIVLAIYFVWRD